jgi:NADPH:quinone reductase-like Zn-dependent oxidoreductase
MVMRAVSQKTFGGPEVLEVVQVPRPAAGAGEVLVRVRAAGVNPADCKVRAGQVPIFGDPPLTVGVDVAGVVEEVGEGVTELTTGQDVYGMVFPPRGAYAEYVVGTVDALAPAPRPVDPLRDAALPLAALTAWQALTDLAPGGRVLVHAAAGGVGHLAVQIAKARGAYVVGTARAARHAFLAGLGVDELVDYTRVDFAAATGDLDLVLDTVGGDYGARSAELLRPGGTLVDVLGTTGAGADRDLARERAEARGARFVEFYARPSSADLTAVTALVEAGELRVHVQEVVPLEEAARAHTLSETGRVQGKIVLDLSATVSP